MNHQKVLEITHETSFRKILQKYRIAVSFPLWADLTLVLRREQIMGAEHKECFWKVGSGLDRREQPKQTRSSRNHSDLRARARPSVTPTLISLVLFSGFLQPPPDVFRISAILDQPGARVTVYALTQFSASLCADYNLTHPSAMTTEGCPPSPCCLSLPRDPFLPST